MPKNTKINIYTLEGGIKKTVALPKAFMTPYRPDLIKKAVRTIQMNKRQPYGRSLLAGMRYSTNNWGPNHGVSRIPRRPGGSRGVMINSTVGGRKVHGPTANKNLHIKMNKKEMLLAKMSAVAQTAHEDTIRQRGHKFGETALPIVLDDVIEEITETQKAIEVLKKLSIYDDILRSKDGTKIRAGKGKLRGRKHRVPKSILLVIKNKKKTGFDNLSGVDVVNINELNVEMLAPGAHAGRLTIFSEGALEGIRSWTK